MSNIFKEVNERQEILKDRLLEQKESKLREDAAVSIINDWFKEEASQLIEAKVKELRLTQKLADPESKEMEVLDHMMYKLQDISNSLYLGVSTSKEVNGGHETPSITTNPTFTTGMYGRSLSSRDVLKMRDEDIINWGNITT